MLSILSAFLMEIIAGAVLVPLAVFYGNRLIVYLKSRRFERRMTKVYKVYEVLQKLRDYLDSHRVLLLRTTNGGGLPAPGNTLYASIIAEIDAPGNDYRQLREEWQNRLIDQDYIRMLERVYTDGHVTNITKKMPKHSMLRGAYEKLGVTKTKIFKIGIFNNAFYYISLACTEDRDMTPAEEYTIETAVAELKKLLK